MADDTGTTSTTDDFDDDGEKPLDQSGSQQGNAQGQAEVPPEVRAALKKANKEAETLRLRLKEFEDRDKTEAQKLLERAETAERAVEQARTEALRSKVAATKGLPADLHEFLTAATEDDLNAQADRLLARIAPPDTQRVPVFNGGPREGNAPTDMNALIRQAARRS